MSGVGKTTALTELGRRGYSAVDTDDGRWIHTVNEPLWREPLIDELLTQPRHGALFVQGTVANQGRFYHRFGAVVLLSAPAEVMFERIARRATNPFGKTSAQRHQIARDLAEVEPILRAAATHEIVTIGPVAEIADTLVSIARDQTSMPKPPSA
ncbi:MAG: AAA family ATPase [Actinobacteria bacterium]|nr:AAA family ATPase [Actinomycetota bacterium]